MPRLDRLSAKNGDGRLRAVLESPQGGRHKYKFLPAEQSSKSARRCRRASGIGSIGGESTPIRKTIVQAAR
jgi:hypothetical protein